MQFAEHPIDLLDMPESRQHLCLGLDVGGTNVKAGLVDRSGNVLSVNTVESHAGGTRKQVLADIDLALAPFRSESAIGLGAGFPSFGDYERGVLDSELSGYPSMHGFPLQQYLEDTYSVPTKLVPDTNLLACGLLRFGEGRQFNEFLSIGLGTGPAVGLVRDGKVMTGPKGIPDVIVRFYTSGDWPGSRKHSGYHFADIYGIDPETAYDRACRGMQAALDIWKQVGEALGETIIRLASETETPTVVIAGGLSAAWRFIKPSVLRCVQPEGIVVVKTKLRHPSLSGAIGLFLPVMK